MKEILCFGDSNTYGWIPGGRGRYDYNTRWTGRLEQKLAPYGYRIAEEGLVGRTVSFEDAVRPGRNGQKLFPAILESHLPLDAMILMLGTNDCKTSYHASAASIGRSIEELIRTARQYDPELEILLVSPIFLAHQVGAEGFDPEFDEDSVAKSRQFKSVYSEIARRTGCAFLAASDYAGPSRADREHLDAAGHAALADALFDKLCAMKSLQAWRQII